MAKEVTKTIRMKGAGSEDAKNDLGAAKYIIDCLNQCIKNWKIIGFVNEGDTPEKKKNYWFNFLALTSVGVHDKFLGKAVGEARKARQYKWDQGLIRLEEMTSGVPAISCFTYKFPKGWKRDETVLYDPVNDSFYLDKEKFLSSYDYDLTEEQSGIYMEAEKVAEAINVLCDKFPQRKENSFSFHARLADLFRYNPDGSIGVEPYIAPSFWKIFE